MLALLCNKRHFLNWVLKDSTTHLHITRFNASLAQKSLFSSSLSKKKPHSVDRTLYFTCCYLEKSCGLSPEKAASVSEKVRLEDAAGADSVIKLFKDFGLTKPQISRIISTRPKLLLANAQKTLLPKLEFLTSLGVSRSDMGKILWTTSILCHSLANQVVPCLEFCKNVFGLNDKEILQVLKHCQRLFFVPLDKQIAPNIEVLRQIGMPQALLKMMVTSFPSLLWQNCERFIKSINVVLEMNFDPTTTKFLHAMSAFSGFSETTRKHKMEVYKRWGWSEEELQSVLRQNPICLAISEKKIMSVMDFLVNEVGWETAEIAKSPWIIKYSLEKRIIPRCSVIVLLVSKGLLRKKPSLVNILCITNHCFFERYVSKYQGEMPELLGVYEGKIGIQQLRLNLSLCKHVVALE